MHAHRVLLADHRGAGLQAFAEPLRRRGHRVGLSRGLHSSLEAFSHGEIDLALVDPLAEGGQAELEALDRARARAGAPPVPLLVLVDGARPEQGVGALGVLQQGAWDLVHRDAPPAEFLLRIERLEFQLAALREMHRWRHRAVHDERTECLRPGAFEHRLQEHFAAAQRHGFELALAVLDLDKFGQVNKCWDHTVGDELLAKVGAAIRASLRTEDCAGRLGGDEFAVLLPYTTGPEVQVVVRRILAATRRVAGELWVTRASSSPGSSPRGPERVTASLGYETSNGKDIEDVPSLRARAERALRAAKQRGGDCGVYYRSLPAPLVRSGGEAGS